MENRNNRGGMRGPSMGRRPAEKSKDFKGTWMKIIRYCKRYLAVIVVAQVHRSDIGGFLCGQCDFVFWTAVHYGHGHTKCDKAAAKRYFGQDQSSADGLLQ